jgi:hypothetical protein
MPASWRGHWPLQAATSSERDSEAASLHIRRDCAMRRAIGDGGDLATGGPAKRVPVGGEAFRTISLYLEGKSMLHDSERRFAILGENG